MVTMQKISALIAVSAISLGACQTSMSTIDAVFASDDSQSRAALKSVLARALGRAAVELGPGDLTQSSSVSVLPPPPGPLEGRSTVTPDLFDIVLKGADCFVVRRTSGIAYALKDISCVALDK